MSRLEANVTMRCLLEFVANNVGNIWIIGVIDEFRRKKCIIVVSMEVGSFGFHGVVDELFEYCVDCLECS